MARPLRLQVAGGIFHVTIRGVRKLPIFHGDDDRRIFLSLVARVATSHAWACLAYVLMTTHYHLLFQTPNPNLASGMQRLNSAYAQGFNRRHALNGHLFERRYTSIFVETDEHLLAEFRYIALNPVTAGICDKPDAWTWSSYPAALGLQRSPRFLTADWILGHFSADLERARTLAREFVEAGLG